MFRRIANIIQSNSFFLFGARGTGKSTLLQHLIDADRTLWIDLLIPEQESFYLLNPGGLSQQLDELPRPPEWVVIDEVQKAPKLLDVAHLEIECRGIKFALSGSSARKLKRGSVNLLAGRAFVNHLYPLAFVELGGQFNLLDALAWGTLLNYNRIATDVGVDWTTVRNYFEIMEDTLLGFLLPPYHRSVRKQQLKSPKFYLFDLGVKRALDRSLDLAPTTGQQIGPLFEQLVICEIARLNHYLAKDFHLSHLATQGGLEVDLVIDRPGQPTALVEIKSSERVLDRHLRHLAAVLASCPDHEAYCLCCEMKPRKVGGIHILPWQLGIKTLGLS